ARPIVEVDQRERAVGAVYAVTAVDLEPESRRPALGEQRGALLLTGAQPVRSEESAFDPVEFVHGSLDVLLHDRPVDPPTLELCGHPRPVVLRENSAYVGRLHRM